MFRLKSSRDDIFEAVDTDAGSALENRFSCATHRVASHPIKAPIPEQD
jgi:hypothetical protein